MSDTETTLRPAEPADEPFLDALYATTRERELEVLPWPESVKRDFLRMQAHAQRADYLRRHPGADVLIIEVDGSAAGRFHVDRGGDDIQVIDISLLPAHRGQGIGGRLLSELLAEAARLRRRVCLRVERSNPARRLYARLGFEAREDDGVYCSMVWSAASPTGAKDAS